MSSISEEKAEVKSLPPAPSLRFLPPPRVNILWVYPSTYNLPRSYQRDESSKPKVFQESIVYRSNYEKHGLNEFFDAIRTQDGDYKVVN